MIWNYTDNKKVIVYAKVRISNQDTKSQLLKLQKYYKN